MLTLMEYIRNQVNTDDWCVATRRTAYLKKQCKVVLLTREYDAMETEYMKYREEQMLYIANETINAKLV